MKSHRPLIESLEARQLLAAAVLRVNSASTTAFIDSSGDAWSADYGYTGGNLATSAFEVAGTTDDSIYYTARYGSSFKYSLAVPNGQYTLRLFWAETYQPNQRKFDVSAEGNLILNDIDLSATYGTKVAIQRDFAVSVADGKLDLQFTGVLGNATIGGIGLFSTTEQPPSPPSPPPPPSPTPGPTKVAFKTVASSPAARAEAGGATVNGKLYVLGGFQVDGSGKIVAIKRSDKYDPTTNKWTRIADMPEPITHAGCAVDGSTIWVVAGYLGDHPGPGITRVYKYNTSSNTWSRGPDLPLARGAGAAAIVGRELHYFGGMNESRTSDEAEHWMLNLDNQSAGWTQRASLLNARNHTAAAAVGGFVYCVGGQHNQEEAEDPQSQVDRYDPTTDTWTQVASLPAPRSHLTGGTFSMNGRIIVVGGGAGFGNPQRTVYSYDPASNKWITLGLLPAARSTVVAGVIGPNQFVSATGNGPSTTTTTWIGTLS